MIVIYTLILTISMFGVGRPAAAIHSVPGFRSKQECISAANAWIAHATRNGSGLRTYDVSALCVPQSVEPTP